MLIEIRGNMYLMENRNAYLIIEGLGEKSEQKMERKKETMNKETKGDKENTL